MNLVQDLDLNAASAPFQPAVGQVGIYQIVL